MQTTRQTKEVTMQQPDIQRPPRLRVLLADDHRMIVEMFSVYLTDHENMEIIIATDFAEAEARLRADEPFDLVLLDYNMPGMDGHAGLRSATQLAQGAPVAIITGALIRRQLDDLLSAGAAGVILKTTPLRSLANAIRFIASGERYLPMELIRQPAETGRGMPVGLLSPKEMTVLELLAEGKPNRTIANELSLAEPTVKMHVTAICRKLGAGNRTQAVVMARDIGLV